MSGTRWTLAATSLLTVALGIATDARQVRQMGGIGLEVFADTNYRGLSATYREDTPDLGPSGMSGRVSSLRVAPGEVWEVCTDRQYRGRCQVVSGNEPDLRPNGWNDVIRSARRVRGGNWGGDSGRSGMQGLELYAGQRFSGQRLIVTEDVSNLRRLNFNDRAASLRVPRGESWEICVNADYDDCRVVTGDVADLGPLSREISSVRLRAEGWSGAGRGRGRGGSVTPSPSITIYDQTNYRGQNTTLESEMSSMGVNVVNGGSLRVGAGRWEVCDSPRFSGHCVIVTGDVPDTRRIGFRDRIWSIRPR